MLAQGPFGRPNLAALAGADGQGLVLSMFDSPAQFFTPTVAVLGAQDIQPVRFNDDAQFFVPAITGLNQVIPSFFSDAAVFFTPLIGVEIRPERLDDAAQFPIPSVTVLAPIVVIPERFDDAAVFFEPFVDLKDKFLGVSFFADPAQFFEPTVVISTPEYVYDYPIGNQLGSDYGIRESMTFYKQRLVLGHRYGRHR